MLASELITRALRLINEPGRGSRLSAADQADAFEALQEILDSEAVSKQFVPGIRTHFFPLQSDKSIYSYGASAQADLRSDDFDDDPLPTKIESAYIRQGATITNNELVDEYRFESTGNWVIGSGGRIENNQYVVNDPAGAVSTTQTLSPVAGRTYTLRVNVEVITGTVQIRFRNSATPFEIFILDSTGAYEFDFPWSTVSTPDVEISTALATDDIKISSLSLIERGKQRLELPDRVGSDYNVDVIDQERYNKRFSKGTSGRPYELLFSRNFPVGEIRFDNAGIAGDILVMDVLVNRVLVNRLSDTIRLHPSATKWLRYALADSVAGEYGKDLSSTQQRIMSDAWTKLATGNRRVNTLRVDRALRPRPRFDINRGDP